MTASAGVAAAADTESRQSAPATDAFAAARAADRAAKTPHTGPASKERFTMTHPDIFAALARERVNTFLSEAQAARQASLARAARPPARAKRVVLRDGSTVLIRPVRSTDAPPRSCRGRPGDGTVAGRVIPFGLVIGFSAAPIVVMAAALIINIRLIFERHWA